MIDVVAESADADDLDGRVGRASSSRWTPSARWVFKTPQNDIMMPLAIAAHMATHGVKTVGFIGFADAYGEGWYSEFSKVAGAARASRSSPTSAIARTDTSVTGQVLKISRPSPTRC